MVSAARGKIRAFQRRFGEPHYRFACHAAVPLGLTPDLLYALWTSFGRTLETPWIAVADLLLSNLCEEVGHELFELDPVVRSELLADLRGSGEAGRHSIHRVATFLHDYVLIRLRGPDHDLQDFAAIQDWVALSYLDPTAAAESLARRLSTRATGSDVELKRMKSIVVALGSELRESEQFVRYLDGLSSLASGRVDDAVATLRPIQDERGDVRIAGVSLGVPERLVRSKTPSRQAAVELVCGPADAALAQSIRKELTLEGLTVGLFTEWRGERVAAASGALVVLFLRSPMADGAQPPLREAVSELDDTVSIVAVLVTDCAWRTLSPRNPPVTILPASRLPISRHRSPAAACDVLAEQILAIARGVPYSPPVSVLGGEPIEPVDNYVPTERTYFRQLDDAWADARTRVVVISGPVGSGKADLVSRWLARRTPYHGGAERVFTWSCKHATEGALLDAVVAFFEGGHERPQPKVPFVPRIARALRSESSLLVLDDIDAAKPEDMSEIRNALAAPSWNGLCIITAFSRLAESLPAGRDGVLLISLPPPDRTPVLKKRFWTGTWTGARGSRFSFELGLVGPETELYGVFNWHFLEIDETSDLRSRTGEGGHEFVQGEFTGQELRLQGQSTNAPTLIHPDEFVIGVSPKGTELRGRSRSARGDWSGRLEGKAAAAPRGSRSAFLERHSRAIAELHYSSTGPSAEEAEPDQFAFLVAPDALLTSALRSGRPPMPRITLGPARMPLEPRSIDTGPATDLAIVHLAKPVRDVSPIPLATREIRLGDVCWLGDVRVSAALPLRIVAGRARSISTVFVAPRDLKGRIPMGAPLLIREEGRLVAAAVVNQTLPLGDRPNAFLGACAVQPHHKNRIGLPRPGPSDVPTETLDMVCRVETKVGGTAYVVSASHLVTSARTVQGAVGTVSVRFGSEAVSRPARVEAIDAAADCAVLRLEDDIDVQAVVLSKETARDGSACFTPRDADSAGAIPSFGKLVGTVNVHGREVTAVFGVDDLRALVGVVGSPVFVGGEVIGHVSEFVEGKRSIGYVRLSICPADRFRWLVNKSVAPGRAASQQRVFERLQRSVASVRARDGRCMGAAFLVTDRYMVTAEHVAMLFDRRSRSVPEADILQFEEPPSTASARLVARSEGIGLLELTTPVDREPLELATEWPRFRDECVVAGCPGGSNGRLVINMAQVLGESTHQGRRTLQLQMVEAEGMSGAAVVVGEHVVGVVSSVFADPFRGTVIAEPTMLPELASKLLLLSNLTASERGRARTRTRQADTEPLEALRLATGRLKGRRGEYLGSAWLVTPRLALTSRRVADALGTSMGSIEFPEPVGEVAARLVASEARLGVIEIDPIQGAQPLRATTKATKLGEGWVAFGYLEGNGVFIHGTIEGNTTENGPALRLFATNVSNVARNRMDEFLGAAVMVGGEIIGVIAKAVGDPGTSGMVASIFTDQELASIRDLEARISGIRTTAAIIRAAFRLTPSTQLPVRRARNDRWHYDIVLTVANTGSDVERVTYHLHPDYRVSNPTVSNRERDFGYQTTTYGDYKVSATLYMRGGRTQKVRGSLLTELLAVSHADAASPAIQKAIEEIATDGRPRGPRRMK